MRDGDLQAREELCRAVCGRLEQLAQKMLRRFPRVRDWVQTDDVLQNSLMRLLKALKSLRPENTREFYGLAALHIRRELLDVARRYRGAKSGQSTFGPRPGDSGEFDDLPDPDFTEAQELERWCAFHEEVEQLPAEEREVVSLVFYHDWTQEEVAEVFGISERTVRRRWRTAMRTLHRHLASQED
jgi:RNA polymerase sigma-70 factor (ECF subfamily)